MLTQHGYIVASVDNRGTPAPRGREWRKVVRNQIGSLRVREQRLPRVVGGCPYVDATRLGVWGWSDGGSMTLHLLFRSPDVYRDGMAVAPVANVHNYDTIYQERYVGLPQDHEAAYHARRRSTTPRVCAAICSSSTAPATTTCTIRAPSS